MSAGFLIRVLPVAPQNRLGSLGADGCGARVHKAEWLPLVFPGSRGSAWEPLIEQQQQQRFNEAFVDQPRVACVSQADKLLVASL